MANSERNIIARLREGIDPDTIDKEVLDEKTYTIGDTQYWARGGKYYSWTASGGKKEVSEDDYRNAVSGSGISKPTSSETKSELNSNKYSQKYKIGDKVKFKHPGGKLSNETAEIIGYDEDGFYKYKWDDGEISTGSGDVNFEKVNSKTRS